MLKITLTISVLFLLMACDKGLEPPVENNNQPVFTIEPLGGNPIGEWVPIDTNPLEVVIIDSTKIPSVVETLVLNPQLEGAFRFYVNGICSVAAVVTLSPEVKIKSLPNPLIFVFSDTLRAEGPFDIMDDKILILPFQNHIFHFDTLGFTSHQDGLDLISINTVFSYEGILDIPVYFIFHLKSQSNPMYIKPNRERLTKTRR